MTTAISLALDAYAVAIAVDERRRFEHRLAQVLPDLPHLGDLAVCPCVDAYNKAEDARSTLWNAINRELEDVPPATPEVVARLARANQRISVLEGALDQANEILVERSIDPVELLEDAS